MIFVTPHHEVIVELFAANEQARLPQDSWDKRRSSIVEKAMGVAAIILMGGTAGLLYCSYDLQCAPWWNTGFQVSIMSGGAVVCLGAILKCLQCAGVMHDGSNC